MSMFWTRRKTEQKHQDRPAAVMSWQSEQLVIDGVVMPKYCKGVGHLARECDGKCGKYPECVRATVDVDVRRPSEHLHI